MTSGSCWGTNQALAEGSRAIDGLLTVGRGQRIGIFGGSGVGKSTLIGMMTRNTEADVTIVGLVGERGREVGEFLDRIRLFVCNRDGNESHLMRPLLTMNAAAFRTFRELQQEVIGATPHRAGYPQTTRAWDDQVATQTPPTRMPAPRG